MVTYSFCPTRHAFMSTFKLDLYGVGMDPDHVKVKMTMSNTSRIHILLNVSFH